MTEGLFYFGLMFYNPSVTDKPSPRAVILSGEPIRDALWFRGASPTKLNVVYSLALFGSESKPVGRPFGSDLAGRLTNALNYVDFNFFVILTEL